MRLPQELRDMIYEYAVTGPNNRVIYCRHTNRQILQISSPNSITPNQNLIEANPLRFVSKQLRAETLGLTLKFNTSVVFSGRTQDRGDSSAITHCTTFINECSRAVLANLSRIELELSGNVSYLPFGSINCLAGDIYAKNPQISLIVRLMHWNVMDDTFIWYFSEYGEYIVYACQFLRLENMKNLRFMPCGDFDRKRLRRKVLKEMQNLFPRGKEMLEEAKQWYKKGIPGVVEVPEAIPRGSCRAPREDRLVSTKTPIELIRESNFCLY
ncbi:uncharacterized protein BDZ99DRAFT_464770 [Mytilinidion resinicola]|uniref:2EXR domain-containing protein n=1 Tax=Mytilinidion resinicola TaxID=574789 RepID=A0A6A6YIT1_9PEZI|nr:uncharacterized protein BDZ99DRAFT_464770 [Mytilinidion resinicola]KAF2807865.1 hypothetical protein BDZ99DRAFT_464770 [Mytilinidion resinicola]